MKYTERFIKQRKFYMMLPVLVLPFITLTFWALGGGKGSTAQAMPVAEGLNTRLPDAQFEEEREEDLWDKFSLYENAARDSAAYETARENDPYFDLVAFQSGQEKPKDEQSKLIGTFKRKDRLIDPNEAKVNSKLEQLYQEISKASDPEPAGQREPSMTDDPQFTEDVSRLESMMEQIQNESKGMGGVDVSGEDDPEMAGINSMLDKLMDVQHPERVRERMNSQRSTSKSNSFVVLPARKSVDGLISQQQPAPSDSIIIEPVENAFFDLEDDVSETKATGNTISAIIHENQVLVSGSTVRLRLLNDVTINSQLVAKDRFLYGTCSINGERLMIDITSILSNQTLIPVSLAVYDLDGLEGIHIPGAISRDAAKQASDDALQNVQLMSMDQSLGVQAASAGIEATKGLISKKVKLIKVTVKAGYQVFLQNKEIK